MSEKYNYEEAVKTDIAEWLEENGYEYAEDADNPYIPKSARDEISDSLWIADSVTGNGSGSYTFSTWQAEENLCHNLDLLREAINEFGGDFAHILESAEGADVTIRCYLIGQVLDECIKKYNETHYKESEEESED